MTTRLIFDCETDGLLDVLTRIHCLGIRDADTGEEWCFRNNAVEDTIEEGLEMLAEADVVIGHNILPFDLRVIEKLYPWWEGKEGQRIRDTLVMCQMIFADQKQRDFKDWRKGRIPGNLIGKHGLEAWGFRTGNHKGDYQKDMKAKGLDPWAEWNQDMEDYMMQDLSTNQSLWDLLEAENYPEEPIVLEHQVQELLTEQQMNGVYFDAEAATALADELDAEIETLTETTTRHYGSWWAPAKKHQIAPLWKDPAGKWKEKAKKCGKPRPEFGEDDSRKVWAEVTVPKVTYKWNPAKPEKAPMEKGVPYCRVVLKEFNPGSRDMIVDRFTTIYGWEPNPDEEGEWTEGGAPAVSDKILRALVHIPMADELAELFYNKKRLGQLRDGKQALLKKVTPEGKIHHRCNAGGTVSGRAAHSDPNLGQVPKVKSGKMDRKQLEFAEEVIGDERVWTLVKQVDDETWSGPLVGRKGKHGWDFRDLFYAIVGWDMVGCDLSGIEFRCLANLTAPYDNGALIHEVLEGDIHTTNQQAAELDTRDQAKTFIYATMYGGGDAKLGSIKNPAASIDQQRAIGSRLRATFMNRMPALAKAIKAIQKQVRRHGYIEGLDGRRLLPRSPHSALNLKLQSDAALIAKKWMLLAVQELEEELNLKMGWDGDFVQVLWVHDELQFAVRQKQIEVDGEMVWLRDVVAGVLVAAAAAAGQHFGVQCPVDAEAKIGSTWAETH